MKTANDFDSTAQSDLFESIGHKSSLVSRVVRQLQDLIVQGRLQQGELLPPERDLAEQLGVSRTVIREAVHELVAKGLLQARAGSGTVVSAPTSKSFAQSMTLLLHAANSELDPEKVLQVRRLLEVEIARLAAVRRTPDDLAKMADLLHQTEQARDREVFAEIDVEFHNALAQATQNELFALLLDSISDVMLAVRRMGFDVPGTPDRSYRHHHAVFEKIEAGDAEGAAQAMREHMVEAEETLRSAVNLSRRDRNGYQ